MKLHHPIPYTILLIVTAVLLTWWTVGIHQRMTVDRNFSRLLNGSPRQIIEATEAGIPIPNRARSRSRLAEVYTQEVFPPNYDRAFEEVSTVLPLHPLDSTLWVQAARFQLFRNMSQEARAALNVSDQIDPRYPIQRIQAIRLWGLLGDQERAINIARNVGRLGSPFREEAAGELAGIGVSPRQIFEIVGGTGLTSDELYAMTSAIIDADPSRVEDAIRQLPPEVVREPDFRRRLAVLLERTKRYHILLLLWEMEDVELQEPVPGLFVSNIDLSLPARAGTFPLGWQVPQDAADVAVRWEAASGGAAPEAGRLEFAIGSEAGRRVRWPIYRTVVPPNKPLSITIHVRQEPFYGGELTFRVRTGSDLIHGPKTDPRVAGAADLTLKLPAQPRADILNLELDWERRGLDAADQLTRLYIDGVTFVDLSEEAEQ